MKPTISILFASTTIILSIHAGHHPVPKEKQTKPSIQSTISLPPGDYEAWWHFDQGRMVLGGDGTYHWYCRSYGDWEGTATLDGDFLIIKEKPLDKNGDWTSKWKVKLQLDKHGKYWIGESDPWGIKVKFTKLIPKKLGA